MSWKKNATRFDLIQRFGETVDLPLFEQGAVGSTTPSELAQNTEAMPRRVLDGTTMKAEALEAINGRLPEAREKVLTAIIDLGRATDREIAAKLGWEINRVIPRRKELQEIKLATADGTKVGEFGLKNIAWVPDWREIKRLLTENGGESEK